MNNIAVKYREQFELFYAKQLGRSHLTDTFTRAGHGYLVGHTQRAWLVWCEAIRYQDDLLKSN